MRHTIAMANNLGYSSLSNNMYATFLFLNNPLIYFYLSKRPDWDGTMSYNELVKWGKNNANAAIYLDASKVNLRNISVKDFQGAKSGKGAPLDTYGPWGINYMTLMYSDGKIKLGEDIFDYRQHEWNKVFKSKGVHFWYELIIRRMSIAILQLYHGVDNEYGFRLRPYGYGHVRSINYIPMPQMPWNLDFKR